MNSLIPTPDTIPVAWGWFYFLLMLTFPMHLLLMNAMLGTTAIALHSKMKRDEVSTRLSHELAKTIPLLVAFAVNLGVAALLFIQVLYGNLIYTSSILMGRFWLAVVPLLIIAYYALYLFDFRFKQLGRAGTAIVALSFLIFLSTAFIFTNNMTMMLDPRKWAAYFDNPGGTILNLSYVPLLPRYLHFIVGGLAVGGLFVAILGRYKWKKDPEVGSAAMNIGMKFFTNFTMAQIVFGFWFLGSMPRNVIMPFLGGDWRATALLLSGILLALHILMNGIKRNIFLAAAGVVPIVYIMSFMRDFVRTEYLKPYFSPSGLVVAPQYSPMVMFFCVLAVAVVCIIWMVRKGANVID